MRIHKPFLILAFLIMFVLPTQSEALPAFETNPVLLKPTAITGVSTTINSVQSIWQVGKDTVLIPTVKYLAGAALDKIRAGIVNYALTGESPALFNDVASLLDETEFDSLEGFAKDAQNHYKTQRKANACVKGGESEDCARAYPYQQSYNECVQGLDPADDFDEIEYCETTKENEELLFVQCAQDLTSCIENGPTQQAQLNYEESEKGQSKTNRNTFRSVVDFASTQVNKEAVGNILQGKGEVLPTFLGGTQNVTRFNQGDFFNWGAYVLQNTDANNSKTGRDALVKATVQTVASEEVANKLKDVQTPLKFLDTKVCVQHKKNETTGKQECVKEITTTPGGVTQSRINDVLATKQNQAELADDLVGLGIEALAATAGDIVDGGLTKIATQALSSISGPRSSELFSSTGFQSSFDVLGVTNDGFIDSSTPTTTVSLGSTGESVLNDSLVGGPEDVLSSGSGPQIIVNLRNQLEKNINLVEEEREYFDLMKSIRDSSKENIIEINRCLPGPDYGWEQRFGDLFPSFNNDVTAQENQLAFIQTQEMSLDPRVNIPGSQDLKNSFETLISDNRQDSLTNKQRTEALERAGSTLSLIKERVMLDFNVQKSQVSNNLVLFESDWVELSSSQKEEVLNKAIENGFYLLRDNETLSSVLNEQELKASDSVINMGWDLWRKETSSVKKNELRYFFYTINNDLSSQQFVVAAQTKYNLLLAKSHRAEDLLADCLTFKLYALGVDEQELEAFDSNSDRLGHPLLSISSSGNLNFTNTSSSRSDNSLKSFLESEYEKTTDASEATQSIFKTSSMTNPQAISRSLLGFGSGQEKDDYFERYEDETFQVDFIKNPENISDLYKVDQLRYGSELTGSLYCRHPRMERFAIFSSQTVCLKNWYRATSLDYEIAFAGI